VAAPRPQEPERPDRRGDRGGAQDHHGRAGGEEPAAPQQEAADAAEGRRRRRGGRRRARRDDPGGGDEPDDAACGGVGGPAAGAGRGVLPGVLLPEGGGEGGRADVDPLRRVVRLLRRGAGRGELRHRLRELGPRPGGIPAGMERGAPQLARLLGLAPGTLSVPASPGLGLGIGQATSQYISSAFFFSMSIILLMKRMQV